MKTRKNRKTNIVKYVPKDFSHLLGKVKGIDDKLMKIHFTQLTHLTQNI